MDVMHLQLKALLKHSDAAFDAFKHNPGSPTSADDYERAKEAVNAHIAHMRAAIENRLR